MLTLVIVVVIAALVFEYINGFHDTANSIATVVATKTLSPMQAVMLAAATNLVGALWGTAVAKTITSGIVDTHVIEVTSQLVLCALIGGIAWNLITWAAGLPSSSSHALIGGLCGAALAAARGNWEAIMWSAPADPWFKSGGVLWKVIVPMVTSPLLGFIVGFLIMGLLYAIISGMTASGGLFRRAAKPRHVNRFFKVAQMVSAQANGVLDDLPGWLAFLHPSPGALSDGDIDIWIKVTCALVMAAGTAAGGWRIIKTLGHKLVKLHPIHGFAAEASAASVITLASSLGIPVSTTHNISSAIMGVGTAKRFNAIKWTVVEKMVWAWILTIPMAGGVAYGLFRLIEALGWA